VRYRRFCLADHEAVLTVACESWAWAYGDFLSPPEIAGRLADWYSLDNHRGIVARVDEGDLFFLVAEDETEIAGFAMGSYDEGELSRLYVRPGRARTGIGGILLGEFLAELSMRAIPKCVVRCDARNRVGLSFYRSRAFADIGVDDEDVVLERKVDPASSVLRLRDLRTRDEPTLRRWLTAPHVSSWYERPEDWIAEVVDRRGAFSFIRHLIAESPAGEPIGFCQYYDVAAADEDCFRSFPREGSYSIDYLVGETRFLSQGLGREMVRALSARVLSLPDARLIVVQPDEGNVPSRKTLESLGYRFEPKTACYLKGVVEP